MILSSVEQLEYVLNKTNARCMIAMFGDESDDWAGKAVTLFPEKDTSGLSDSGWCIRVKGSPDIKKAVDAIMPATRFRKAVTRKLVPTGKGKGKAEPDATPDVPDGDESLFDPARSLPGDPEDL